MPPYSPEHRNLVHTPPHGVATPEVYEARALTDMAARMRAQTPAPAAPAPAPAPARKTKQVWDEATGTFKTVEVP